MPIIGRISVGDGATFTPDVTDEGVLTWTNNKNLENPDPVDIAQAVVDKKPGWGIPIGYEYFTINPNIPQGSLPLFGGEYDRATYPDLWAWVQEQTGYLKTEAQWQALSSANAGNVPYYSDGDGSTTFRVPSLKCWIKAANGTVSEVGSYLAAGLPNITGTLRGDTTASNGSQFASQFSSGSEALQPAGTVTQGYGANFVAITEKQINSYISFNASKSNSIYGNSTTVQPPSIVGMWLVKAYGVVEETGRIDEQQYIDDRFAAAKDYTDMEVETGVPTGCVQAFAGQNTPNGWLLCDGSAVSRVTYAKLFAVIGTKYGSGDGSTTFNVPNLIDRFVQGNATAGTVKSAGLPNITGDVQVAPEGVGSCPHINYSGALEKMGTSGAYVFTHSGIGTGINFGIRLNASKSNSIYGNSTTVQPPALTMRYIIKY